MLGKKQKRKMKMLFSSLALCMGLALCSELAPVQAAEITEASDYENVTRLYLSQEDIKSAGSFSRALKKLVNSGHSAPFEITVAPGTYEVSQICSIVPSNTTLILTDVTLKRTQACNIFKFGGGVHSTQNIKIIDGTLDGGGTSGTLIKVGDFENFTMEGTTLQNVYDAHEMEIAGVNGMKLSHCVFKDQIIPIGTDTNRYEAIQLDILTPSHISGYPSKCIPNKNITISDCTFENVPRGIGSHTAIHNCPAENITISNCTFQQIGGAAIQTLNWINCTFHQNTITDASRGISVYNVRNEKGTGTYLPSVIAENGNGTTSIPDSYERNPEQNIVITNNIITLNNKADPYAKFAKAGISIIGFDIRTAAPVTKDGGGLPIGNYDVSGVEINHNSIITAGYGMYLSNASNCIIDSNSITGKDFSSSDAKKKDYDGIFVLNACKNNCYTNNSIQSMPRNGIFCMDKSSSTSISKNQILSCGGYGIGLFNGSTATGGISNNLISKCKSTGIALSTKCTAKEITNNTIKNCTGTGISIYKKSKVTKQIANNTIKGGNKNYHGISVSTSSSVKGKILKNKITGKYYKQIAVDTTSSAKY